MSGGGGASSARVYAESHAKNYRPFIDKNGSWVGELRLNRHLLITPDEHLIPILSTNRLLTIQLKHFQ
jgi:hypothetical protein